jgi:hypothetical protein
VNHSGRTYKPSARTIDRYDHLPPGGEHVAAEILNEDHARHGADDGAPLAVRTTGQGRMA